MGPSGPRRSDGGGPSWRSSKRGRRLVPLYTFEALLTNLISFLKTCFVVLNFVLWGMYVCIGSYLTIDQRFDGTKLTSNFDFEIELLGIPPH